MKGRRALRGGCFVSNTKSLSVTYRFEIEPVLRIRFNGFRLMIRRKS